MQAGLVSKRLSFRDIFTVVAAILLCVLVLLLGKPSQTDDTSLGLAA